MKNVKVIFFKEMKRIFTDRRMLLALFLPGILIFFLYSFMGQFFSEKVMSNEVKNASYRIAYTDNYSVNAIAGVKPTIINSLINYVDNVEAKNNNQIEEEISFDKEEIEDYKTMLINDELDLVISFSDNFDDKDKKDNDYNNISIFYNGKTSISSHVYSIASALISTSYNNYTVNTEEGEYVDPNLSEEEFMLKKVMAFIFPMLTVSMLASAAMSICPETIAGEKERGTLTSILLTPIKRKEFVYGKVSALTLVAISGGLASFLGIIFSLPKIFGGASLGLSPLSVLLTFFIIISMMLFFVSFGVLISAISSSIKEANSYLGPLTGLFMALSLIPSIVGTNMGYAFVPILNLSSSLSALISGSPDYLLMFIISIAMNIVYSLVCIYITTILFNKEKVILGH